MFQIVIALAGFFYRLEVSNDLTYTPDSDDAMCINISDAFAGKGSLSYFQGNVQSNVSGLITQGPKLEELLEEDCCQVSQRKRTKNCFIARTREWRY